jgi:PilZ domain
MTESTQPSGAERRRSERVFLQVAIFAQGVSSDGHAFREKTKTLAVNAHGALIHLPQDVPPGETITLTHGLTQEQQTCRVVYAKPMSGNIRAVGVEFLKPAPKFWQIAFPPSDWKPFEE